MKTIGLAVAVLLVLAPAVSAFEPMPPIMQTLLVSFPEKNGWFVDEPLGAVPGTPDEAKPFFECFRVIVPDLESLDKAIGRLMANAPKLPIRKITRYDREPGAPGLAGFRGIWCKTEDESLVGFAIVTVNQNRFLLWARQGYYPSFAVDSINAKVRDQYARDVSRYLAGVDAKVPENEVPQAPGRMLPEWMDLFPPVRGFDPGGPPTQVAEIRSWGLRGVVAIVPTAAMTDTIIAAARDTLWSSEAPLQALYEDQLLSLPKWSPREFRSFDHDVFYSLPAGTTYDFVVDRYGRVRFGVSPHERDERWVQRFFPEASALSTGLFTMDPAPGPPARVAGVTAGLSPFFWPGRLGYPSTEVPLDSLAWMTEEHLRSLGHFLRVLRDAGIPLDGIWIRKFWLY